LRAQTLEEGSGRLVAFEFAWAEIIENPFFGKGFSYDHYWFIEVEENLELLLALNHQGNTHNSFLSILMNTGFLGFATFLLGWGSFISKAIKKSPYGFFVLLIILFSANIEAWLSASLNPFVIILIIILTLLTDKNFIRTRKK